MGNQPKTTFLEWADRMIPLLGSERLPDQQWFSRVNALLLTENLDTWRQDFGEEQVNEGVTRLLNHVAKCWQPSWYEFAGALLPAKLPKDDHAVAPEPHVKEQVSTGDDSNTYPSLVMTPLMFEIDLDGDMGPPAFFGTVSASIVEEIDESQTSLNLQSGKQESVPAIELQGSLRPRRQARDNALVKIREAQGQPKKRSRSSGRNLSPGAKRRKTPTKRANEPAATSVEAEEETRDTTGVETALQASPEEAIPPIIVAVQKTCMSNDTHPSGEPRASVSVDVLGDPPMQRVNKLDYADYEGMVAALRKQKTLIKEIALTEAHIESLRDGIKNWNTLTDAARKMLGRYHTQEDILGTLSLEKANLRDLRAEMNCVEYRIERLRPGENLTRNHPCIVKQ